MNNDAFEKYAGQYSKVIAEGARASGESYEYMVELRTRIFRKITAGALKPISNPAILDFGCGTGYTVGQLSVLFDGAYLHGFDTSSESITHAISRNIAGACFSQGEVCPLPYPDNTFDAIYSNGTIHHIVQNERALWMKELHRVTKKQGVLVIFENNPLNPLMMQAMRRTPFDNDADPIRAGKLLELIEVVGFHPCTTRFYFFSPRALKWFRFTEPLLGFVPFGAQYYVKSVK